jgi:hypothetical protein
MYRAKEPKAARGFPRKAYQLPDHQGVGPGMSWVSDIAIACVAIFVVSYMVRLEWRLAAMLSEVIKIRHGLINESGDAYLYEAVGALSEIRISGHDKRPLGELEKLERERLEKSVEERSRKLGLKKPVT